MANIGIIGTGFIAQGLARTLQYHPELRLTRMLTRRPRASWADHPFADRLTDSLDDLMAHADLVVECTGDIVATTDRVQKVMAAGLPVVTMNSEFQITTGSWFVDKGYITEAEGDQPGSLAALHEEAVGMGFRPLVYGNSKGFLNLDPKPDEMAYWAEKQGISVKQTTAFTDGTKVQIEQVFVANGLGADIAQPGLLGPRTETWQEAGELLAERARALGRPVSDYIIAKGRPPAVFMVAEHDAAEVGPLRYFKLGDGPLYFLPRDYHLCFFEIPRTIQRALEGKPPLLTNTRQPRISVGAIAKRALPSGTAIPYAIGSFDFRGEAVRVAEAPDHVPIGILEQAVLRRAVEPGQMLTWDDVDIPDSLALDICHELYRPAAPGAAAGGQSA